MAASGLERGMDAAFWAANGCFHKLSVLLVGVFVIRGLLFGIHIRAPDCRKPCSHVMPEARLLETLTLVETQKTT